MARGDELYARLEVSFMHRLEFLSIPVGARFLYLALWCYALGQRREVIPNPGPGPLACMAGLVGHPIATYLKVLASPPLSLLKLDATCQTIELVGIRKKHLKYQWASSPYGERMGPICDLTRARDTEIEIEKEIEIDLSSEKNISDLNHDDLEVDNALENLEAKDDGPMTANDLEQWIDSHNWRGVWKPGYDAERWCKLHPTRSEWANAWSDMKARGINASKYLLDIIESERIKPKRETRAERNMRKINAALGIKEG
jgi:hypothetical protein